MKIENTLENKAKFFALYWGQKAVHYNNNLGGLRNISQEHFNDDSYLELTPLSQITDKDKEYLRVSRSHSCDYFGYWYGVDDHAWSASDVDFLRSKGYLMPYMGEIDELLKYGWVKLKD